MQNCLSVLVAFILLNISNIVSAQEIKFTGLDFDDEGYGKVLKKARRTRGPENLPVSTSLRMYAPYPKSQGWHGTCSAWASAYCGRTIVEAIKQNWTDRNYITENAYSPAFLFRLMVPKDSICRGGSALSDAFDLLKEKGVLTYNEFPGECTPVITDSALTKAGDEKIKDFVRLFDITASNTSKIDAVKKSLSEKKPVVFGMTCPPSFLKVIELWEPTEEPVQSYGGHALCAIGYDDEKFGGAFEIQNSWGTEWAKEGYCWIKYEDFARFTRYAYEFIDLPVIKPTVPDLSGNIKLVLENGNQMPAALFVPNRTRGLRVVPTKSASDSSAMPGSSLALQDSSQTEAGLSPAHYRTLVPYASGTRFRIYISNNEPAYVYAISTDLSNEITKIFPYVEGISAALTDKKTEVAIPDEEHFIEFDYKPGRDWLCVLYSKDEMNIDDVVKKISEQKGNFSERVYKALSDKIAESKATTYSKDNIAFTGFTNGKSIVPLIVMMEHK